MESHYMERNHPKEKHTRKVIFKVEHWNGEFIQILKSQIVKKSVNLAMFWKEPFRSTIALW
jgi:hypothetical protein